MPSQLTYPGVYVEEIPSGVHTIVGVATSITAFIGRAASGPTDQAVVINGYGDYERIYGGLAPFSAMSYAVRDFFLNGGSQAVIVRLYHPDPGPGGATPAPASNSTVLVDTLPFVAADPGSWGQNLRAFVDRNVKKEVAKSLGLADENDLFNLTVFEDIPGGLRESFSNLSVKKSKRRVDKVLQAESSLIRWKSATNNLDLPAGVPAIPGGDILSAPAQMQTALQTAQQALADLQKKKPPATEAELKSAQDAVDTATSNLRQSQLNLTQGVVKDAVSAATSDTVRQAALSAMAASDGLGLVFPDDFNPTGAQNSKKGLYSLDKVDLFNLLCIPPYGGDIVGDVDDSLLTLALSYCVDRRAMLLVDPKSNWTSVSTAVAGINNTTFPLTGDPARNAALFFPRLLQSDPNDNQVVKGFVPCGAVAGVFARTDAQRGVWKAPAGVDASLVGVPDLGAADSTQINMTDPENGRLNPLGVNCLRSFPIIGRVVWGSRTLRGADALANEWKYVPVRRTALYIEESLYRGLKWAVFEPNDEPLWAQIRLNAGAFMQNLFRQHAFQGLTPGDAYFVKCDSETTTQNDIDNGIVNILVGFAPLKPAEFVVIQIQQIAGQIQT
jgi:uncharacterized protein